MEYVISSTSNMLIQVNLTHSFDQTRRYRRLLSPHLLARRLVLQVTAFRILGSAPAAT
jgi:hypothetical protein